VQLAPGCAREGWFSLLWRGGCSGETLLPYALPSGLCTSSQRSKGYCGRLTFAARIQIRATLYILRIAVPHTADGSAEYSTVAVVRCIIGLLCMRRRVSGQVAVDRNSVAGPFAHLNRLEADRK
jgi:hypothetical protein